MTEFRDVHLLKLMITVAGCFKDASYVCCYDTRVVPCLLQAFVCLNFRPKSGYFGIDIANPFGALSCFCYGHSSLCKRASGYRSNNISTTFSTGIFVLCF